MHVSVVYKYEKISWILAVLRFKILKMLDIDALVKF